MEPLVGREVLLREYREEDIVEIYEWTKDRNTTRWMGPRYRSQRALEEIQASVRKVMLAPPADAIFFVIADRTTEKYFGGIDLTAIDLIDRNAVLSIVISKKANRNRGIGTDAIRTLLDFVFNEMNLHKVELGVDSNNEWAVKCYQKVGFKIEGVIRDHTFIDGRYSNLYKMGILETEFPGNE